MRGRKGKKPEGYEMHKIRGVFRDQESRFRDQDAVFKVQGSGCRVQGSGWNTFAPGSRAAHSPTPPT